MRKRGHFTVVIAAITLTFGAIFLANNVDSQAPRNARIAFLSSRPWEGDGYSQVYAMDITGENIRRLTNGPGFRSTPKWSPDGKHIAFAMYVPGKDIGGFHDIYVINADGGDLLRLTNEVAVVRWPTWSPNSREVAFFVWDGTGITIADIRGQNRRQVTKTDAVYAFLAWSPDGRKIAFSSGHVFDKGVHGRNNIYTLDMDTGKVRRLTEHPEDDLYSTWSPDSKKIAFSRGDMEDREGDLYIMDADGKNERLLTGHPADDVYPAWSPDGSQIAFTRRAGGRAQIYLISVDGSDLRRISDGSALSTNMLDTFVHPDVRMGVAVLNSVELCV